MRGVLLAFVLLVGCSFQFPASRTVTSIAPDGAVTETTEEVTLDPRCIEAVRIYNGAHISSVIFNALGTASSGAVVTSEFLTDEEWVPAAFSIAGLVFGGVGIATGLVADDAAEDVLRYCGEAP